MRKWAFSAILLAVAGSLTVSGAILTCNNRLNSPGQYSSLQAALDAADAGDTIYIHGSDTSYGDVTVRKRITLIGPGYNPNKQSALPAEILTVTLNAESDQVDSSGTHMMGLIVRTIIGPGGAQAFKRVEDVVIERCRITQNLRPRKSANWTVKHNIITGNLYWDGAPDQCDGLICMNNVIGGRLWSAHVNVSNVIITNNVFIDNAASIYANQYAKNIIFTNNVFHGISPYHADNVDCTWTNNLSAYSNDNRFNLDPVNGNTGGANLEGIEPEFVDTPRSKTTFSYTYDLHPDTGSPLLGAGSPGTDIGIYGGTAPWPDGGPVPWQTSPMPYIPIIESVDIQNANIPLDGTLSVKLKARTND
jgi:hypothetical protein